MGYSFAERLQGAVDASGKTPYRVAKDAGISTPHFYNLMNGKREPTEDVLKKLAPVLDIPEAQLKAWARAEGMSEEEQRYLLADVIAPHMTTEQVIEAINAMPPEQAALLVPIIEAAIRDREAQEGK